MDNTFKNKVEIEDPTMYKDMIERSWDVLFMTDLIGNIIYISPSCKRILGCAPEDVVGNHFKKYISLRDMAKALAAFTSSIMTKTPMTIELQMVRSDNGKNADIEISGSFVIKDGKIAGIQGAIRDITDRKIMENQLKDKIAELENTNKIMIGRELKMAELKTENETLKEKIGKK